jgi:hypothetical protein
VSCRGRGNAKLASISQIKGVLPYSRKSHPNPTPITSHGKVPASATLRRSSKFDEFKEGLSKARKDLHQKINLVNVLIWLVYMTASSGIFAHGLARPGKPDCESKMLIVILTRAGMSSRTYLDHERHRECGTCCPSFVSCRTWTWS